MNPSDLRAEARVIERSGGDASVAALLLAAADDIERLQHTLSQIFEIANTAMQVKGREGAMDIVSATVTRVLLNGK
jgi:hypothetical protein